MGLSQSLILASALSRDLTAAAESSPAWHSESAAALCSRHLADSALMTAWCGVPGGHAARTSAKLSRTNAENALGVRACKNHILFSHHIHGERMPQGVAHKYNNALRCMLQHCGLISCPQPPKDLYMTHAHAVSEQFVHVLKQGCARKQSPTCRRCLLITRHAIK